MKDLIFVDESEQKKQQKKHQLDSGSPKVSRIDFKKENRFKVGREKTESKSTRNFPRVEEEEGIGIRWNFMAGRTAFRVVGGWHLFCFVCFVCFFFAFGKVLWGRLF